MLPKIRKITRGPAIKECPLCGRSYGPDAFAPIKSLFAPDGRAPICDNCINNYLESIDYDWGAVNKLCQYFDIPFIPAEFLRVQKEAQNNAFHRYAEIFQDQTFEELGWDKYFQAFKELEKAGQLEEEIPVLSEARLKNLRRKWGPNYDKEELDYLEQLHAGILTTQNVNGTLQSDQALKLCKLSLEIDSRIRAGSEIDKLLSSYDKLVKIAEFTPRNAKNAGDLDSTGELIKWLEAGGWQNNYYDGASKDIVDETIQNIQMYNQRLYTNESGIGEEITRRLEALKTANEKESYYDDGQDEYDLEDYENEGYKGLMEEFDPSLDEEGVNV